MAGDEQSRIRRDGTPSSQIIKIDRLDATGSSDGTQQGGLAHGAGTLQRDDRLLGKQLRDQRADTALHQAYHRSRPPCRDVKRSAIRGWKTSVL
jgi:hypothetical protein